MGKANRPRRLTRAEKIEQDRMERQELKRLQSKPWWPVKAETEKEAIQLLAERLDRLDQDQAKLAFSVVVKDFTLIGQISENETFLKEVPEVYIEKAKLYLRKQEESESFDDYDDALAEDYAHDRYMDKLDRLSLAELQTELDVQCDAQGRAGDMSPINEVMAANALSRIDMVNAEIAKRKEQYGVTDKNAGVA